VSRQVNKTAISTEPPCWGSGELGLVPAALASALKGVRVSGLALNTKSRKLSWFHPEINHLMTSTWVKTLSSFSVDDPSMTFLDVAVSSVQKIYVDNPDRLDVPVVTLPLDRVDYALRIPLEMRTWDLVVGCGVETDHDMCTLLMGTFREMCDRLGDVRAALDLAVTGSSWLVANESGSYGFLAPVMPGSFVEAVELTRVRAFRGSGWLPSSPQYTAMFADVMGRRWSIGISKPWTLQQCSDEIGVTRERIRQMELLALWESPSRSWGRPSVLEAMYEQLVDFENSSIAVSNGGEAVDRETAIDFLVRWGYPAEDFDAPWSVTDELDLHGIKWSKVQSVAYGESEKLGFISLVELRHHIAEQFPALVGEMFDDVIDRLVLYSDLPHGFVYLNNKRSSWVEGWLSKLHSVLGQLSFEETYKALERACTVRVPRLVFPPRGVVKEFLVRHPKYWSVDGMVGLQNPVHHQIDGVEKWLREQIESCTGTVIHKTELWNRAREAGVKGGTLNVYTMYHLLFKPCGSGCVTMTGLQPSSVAIELAQIRAKAIRVGTRRSELSILDGVVSLEVEAGNDLLDTGVLSTSKEMRTMIENKTFKIMSAGSQHGTARWSNGMLTGFSTVLQVMGVQPGEEVVLSFDTASGDVNVKLAVE